MQLDRKSYSNIRKRTFKTLVTYQQCMTTCTWIVLSLWHIFPLLSVSLRI